MHVSKKAAVILAPALLFGAHARAWSANTDQSTANNAQIVAADRDYGKLLNLLNPIARGIDSQRRPQQNCKGSEIYSQHDVVGDPESCVMGRYGNAIGASFAPATAP